MHFMTNIVIGACDPDAPSMVRECTRARRASPLISRSRPSPPEPNTGTPAILGDEFDAGGLQSGPYLRPGRGAAAHGAFLSF